MKGWLVNDCLTAIPGTVTFWHDLLRWLPDLQDKTGGYTPFDTLASVIEEDLAYEGQPEYIVRNATFFRRLRTHVRTISLLQDCYDGELRANQLDVCRGSEVVFNSPFTASQYPEITRAIVIPLGTDFNFFKPLPVSDGSVIFVGSTSDYPKGFDRLRTLVESTDFKFRLVLKDDLIWDHPRVEVHSKVSQQVLLDLLQHSSALVCTSRMETLHLSGIEAAACNLPIVAPNVGVYYGLETGEWGTKVSDEDFASALNWTMSNLSSFKPREFFLGRGMDLDSCKQSWLNLINNPK
jgi:glycosyltransferase involved in cell wall biosynthesis